MPLSTAPAARNTLGLGGAFLSNLATLSADYQTFYVPARTGQPFQRALILNAQVHLFGRATVNASTFLAPDGRLLSTTSGEATLTHGADPAPPTHIILGANLLRGRVLDITAGTQSPPARRRRRPPHRPDARLHRLHRPLHRARAQTASPQP